MTPTDENPNKAGQIRYLTTAIPYVNAAPHVGFALEMIQADCLARLYRGQGHVVRFQAGTDENSLKNVQAADAAGVTVETLVGSNAQKFLDLKGALNLSFDDFIRTSSEARHRFGVEALWAACAASGDIYKRDYQGLYCTGCEQFYKAEDLVDGVCPDHGTEPDSISEENYFFRLSNYGDALRTAIEGDQIEIVPPSRRNEVLAWIDAGLEDFSISRSASRARGWGIPVPGDPDQVIYVWFDALGNYITALGYGSDGEDFETYWRSAPSREHVIGKGITRFHALYWPAMLLSAGLNVPTRILVHGYVTVDGKKIGKAVGNAIDPIPVANAIGADALRYYLLRHIRSTEDGDFSHDRCQQAYQSELAGQLGNLAHRTISMIERYCDGVIPAAIQDRADAPQLVLAGRDITTNVQADIERFAFHEALSQIWSYIADANKFVSDCEPWALAKQVAKAAHPDDAAAAKAALDACLYDLACAIAVIGKCLAPLLPATGERLLEQLGIRHDAMDTDGDTAIAGNRVKSGDVLFPKLD